LQELTFEDLVVWLKVFRRAEEMLLSWFPAVGDGKSRLRYMVFRPMIS